MGFLNKTVIITGAAVGIGKATAVEFAKAGANVCLVDMDAAGLEKIVQTITEQGGKATSYVCDVSNEERVRQVVQQVEQTCGKVDILVNNAGIWRGGKPFVETTSEHWKKRLEVNVLGMMYFSHAVLPGMIQQEYGRIINVGSVAGVYGIANMVAYSTTKGAVSAFTKALAKEVAAQGITVNNVVPGSVRNEGAGKETDMSYMNRRGELEEYAYLICFLASDKAAYISGQDYQIDGCRRKN